MYLILFCFWNSTVLDYHFDSLLTFLLGWRQHSCEDVRLVDDNSWAGPDLAAGGQLAGAGGTVVTLVG